MQQSPRPTGKGLLALACWIPVQNWHRHPNACGIAAIAELVMWLLDRTYRLRHIPQNVNRAASFIAVIRRHLFAAEHDQRDRMVGLKPPDAATFPRARLFSTRSPAAGTGLSPEDHRKIAHKQPL